MKIYLDYIFFENILVNLIITLFINHFTENIIKKINVIIGVIFISLYTTVIYVLKESFLNSMFMKIITVIIFIYIVFKPNTIIKLFKNTIYYYLFSFIYIGIIICISLMFNINLENSLTKIITYIISSIVLYIFTKYLWKMWRSNIKNSDLTYTINISGQEIIGFVDTGNSVKDLVTNLDVIFIDSIYKEKLKSYIDEKKKITINFNTINNNSLELGYIFNNVYFYKNEKLVGIMRRIIICFVNDSLANKKYSALIGYNTYINNLKGVTFC